MLREPPFFSWSRSCSKEAAPAPSPTPDQLIENGSGFLQVLLYKVICKHSIFFILLFFIRTFILFFIRNCFKEFCYTPLLFKRLCLYWNFHILNKIGQLLNLNQHFISYHTVFSTMVPSSQVLIA